MSANELRNTIREYIGMGWTTTGYPISLEYLTKVEYATEDELIQMGINFGILRAHRH